MIHTYMEDWSDLDAVTVGISVCVYINKCVIRFHWHYPTQRDNNVTFLTTLCILLEYPAPCQDAQACSSPLPNMLPLLTTNKINPYTVAVLSWWMIIGGCTWKTTSYEDHWGQSGENAFILTYKLFKGETCTSKTTNGSSGKLSYYMLLSEIKQTWKRKERIFLCVSLS